MNSDTITLLFELQKKINRLQLFLEAQKKSGGTNDELTSALNQLNSKIDLLATTEDLQALSEQFSSNFTSLTTDLTSLNSLLLNTNSLCENIDSEVELTNSNISSLITSVTNLNSSISTILASTNTIIQNQSEMLSLLENGSSSNNNSGSNSSDLDSKIDTIDNKIDLIMEKLEIAYDGTENGSGDNGGLDEFVEPDLSEQLTSSDKFIEQGAYSGNNMETDKIYFRSNVGETLIVVVEPTIYMPVAMEVNVEFYFNDVLVDTKNYSCTEKTTETPTFVYVTKTENQINSVHMKLTGNTNYYAYIKNTSYSIFSKNAEFISYSDHYKVSIGCEDYILSKNSATFSGYATIPISDTFDEQNLSYTSFINNNDNTNTNFMVEAIKKTGPLTQEKGLIVKAQINCCTHYFSVYKSTGASWIGATINSTDVAAASFSSNVFYYPFIKDNVVQASAYNIDGLKYTLSNSYSNIPFGTTEEPLLTNAVRLTTAPNTNASAPSFVMTTKSGNNFFNYNCQNNGVNVPIALGYGTRIKAAVLNDNLDIGIFMRVYGKFIMKKLLAYRTTFYSGDTNRPTVNAYKLDEQTYVIGEYDEIHPGYNGEFFAIKNDKIEKLKLPNSLLEFTERFL